MTLKHIHTKNRGIWEEFAIRGLWLARKTEMAARSYSVEECNMDKNRTVKAENSTWPTSKKEQSNSNQTAQQCKTHASLS